MGREDSDTCQLPGICYWLIDMSSPSRADSPEWAAKQVRVIDWLDRRRLDGVLLWKRGNFAWITCGRDNRIVDSSETGVAGILATRRRRVCVADSIEAPRMRGEELAGSNIEVIEFPWHDDDAARNRMRALLGDLGLQPEKVAADIARPQLEFAQLPEDFNHLRWQLTAQEIDRYREGGRRASGAVEEAAGAIYPGITEEEIGGILDRCVRCRGLVPMVNLVATDERIFRYRHPIATSKKLERYAMLVICASYGGLISNLTRFVHFGEPPEDLKRRQRAVAHIDVAVNLATRPGRTLGEIFTDLQQAYAAAGFAGEWKLHHQGGSTGYAPREVIAKPGDDTRVLEHQAFAWNPSITGTKSEDTILVTAEGLEVLTKHSQTWPATGGGAPAGVLSRAGCLVNLLLDRLESSQ